MEAFGRSAVQWSGMYMSKYNERVQRAHADRNPKQHIRGAVRCVARPLHNYAHIHTFLFTGRVR